MALQNSQKGISALLLVAIIAVLAVGGVGYYMSQKKSSSMKVNEEKMENKSNTEEKKTEEMTGSPSAVPSAATLKEHTIEVSGKNFSFTPSTISVAKGEKVKILFKNTQGTHNFIIEGMDVASKIIQADQSDTVEFTADKAGTFKYYCSVGKHRQMGMEGTLIVN